VLLSTSDDRNPDALSCVDGNVRMPVAPQGNLLLVGVGGSGKQSLARLAAHAAGFDTVFEVVLTRGYDEAAFREDLKRLYAIVGSENKKVTALAFRITATTCEGMRLPRILQAL
jgi:dynein heavy chain, axonemal